MSGPGVAHGIQVCNYKNSPHLCFYQGTQMIGYGKGHGIIMDNHYQIVKTMTPASSSMTMDLHEFMLRPDGRTALMTIYYPRAADLSDWGIRDGMGWIQDGIFQEVDVETGKLVFEWRSLEHIDPQESWVPPATTEISGDGSTKDTPWDYFHINSIDKNADGDYLISARHVSAIYKISGKDGHIIWRLNGVQTDYRLDDFHFSSQHDARWVSENVTHTVLSLYDNASNGFNDSWAVSRGMIITMDHQTKVARMDQEYLHPAFDGIGLRAKSQGNTQVLSNGHVVQGWGPDCYITEHLADGTPIFSAWAARIGMMIYRAYKFEWKGEPLWDPNAFAYSKDRRDTAFYASWNGATEVTHWRFYGASSRGGPFHLVQTVKKQGFETRYRHEQDYYPYVYAEAMHDQIPIGKSPIEQTFSPGEVIRPSCDEWGCPLATPLETDLESDEERIFRETEENRAFDVERLRKATQAQSSRPSKLFHSAKQQIGVVSPFASFGVFGVALSLVMLRAKMRARIFGVLLWVREVGVDVAHGRGTERMARWRGAEYTRLPTMVER
jgi:Arylsulfotransferase (ASST)